MGIRYVSFFLVLLAVSACTSDHSFKNEQEFASYVSHLGLSALTVPSAVSKINTEGFNCYPQKNTLYCIREVKELVCNQKQIINLPSPETNQLPLKVSTHLGLVCL